MSGYAVDWVWSLRRPRRNERLLLAVLASHARGDGVCWPGFERLAEEAAITGVSRIRVVKRCLRAVEGAGELEARPAMLGPRRITVYRLAWPGRRPLDLDEYDWRLLQPFTADRPLAGYDPPAPPARPFDGQMVESVGAVIPLFPGGEPA